MNNMIRDDMRICRETTDARILEVEEEKAGVQARLQDLTNELGLLKALSNDISEYLNEFYPERELTGTDWASIELEGDKK